jgi:hypothetical protein
MTSAEKKRLSTVLHATEFLFLENMALKLVLEHRGVTNWQKLVDHLLADKEMLGGVRLIFETSTAKSRNQVIRQQLLRRFSERFQPGRIRDKAAHECYGDVSSVTGYRIYSISTVIEEWENRHNFASRRAAPAREGFIAHA